MLTSPRPHSRPRSFAAAVGLALALFAGSAAAGVAEEWYLLRARANVKIHNYKAAIEAYRKAIEENPRNREALLGLGIAYEANGQTDDAIGAYDRYLAQYPDDGDVALKQARALRWSRYEYRRHDAIRYYRAALARRDDPVARRELAQLLARDKANVDEALEQYRILLRQSPDDSGVRSEYRKVLLWDPRHLEEAIAEYSAFALERPNDVVVQRQLARLLAQDPRRNAEAIAQYARVLERTPGDRPLRLEYARALARDPSRRGEALEQLRAAKVERADRPTRILYADLLAARDETREQALAEYRALLAEKPQDTPLRLKYARLLGARQETSPAAIAEYERILGREPTHGDAHAGLAQALAWNGENDRALHHGRLAQRYGTRAGEVEVRALEQTLGEGREPTLGGGFAAVLQPGTHFALYGFRAPVRGRIDPSAFVTAWAEAGVEHFWGALASAGTSADSATGAFAALESEIRLSRALRGSIGVGYRSLRPGASAISAVAGLELRTQAYALGGSLERRPRLDSFVALVNGVTENRLSLRYERRLGPWHAWLSPAVALVEGGRGPLNSGFEMEGGAELELLHRDRWELLVGYGATGSHYASDASRAASGGYFSPAFHAVQTPRLTLRHAVERRHWIEVSGGPGLQYQLLHSGRGGFMPGGEARARARVWLAERFEWTTAGSFVRMGDAFSRFEAATSLTYLF